MAVDRAPDIRPHARTILLANAGQRDIRLDGKYIGQRSTDPLPDGGSGVPTIRSESREILNAFDDWVGMLSAPIIQQAIESLSPQTIDQVVVYGTDQPVSVAEKHRGGDTLHMAELVARILQHAEAASSVRCRAVGKPNVHLADVMYRFFRNEFRSADPHLSSVRRDYDTPARVIVSLAGGTPGANLGLLLAAIEAFGDRVEAIQPSEDGSARRLDISAIIRRQALTQPARQLLGLGQFDAAAQVIRAWDPDSPLAAMADALQRWVEFDDDTALAIATASDSRSLPAHVQREFERMRTEITEALQTRTATYRTARALQVDDRTSHEPDAARRRFHDLYWAADLCARQGRVVDFVSRATRLNEAALRWMIGRELKVNASDQRENRAGFWRVVRDRIGSPPAPKDSKADATERVDVPNLLKVAGALVRGGVRRLGNEADASRFVTFARRVDKVRDLRNQSVGGHGFDGVADRTIVDEITRCARGDGGPSLSATGGMPTALECLDGLLGALGMKPAARNPFLNHGATLASILATAEFPVTETVP